MDFIKDFLEQTWSIINLSANWLLIGFAIAGFIHVLLPRQFIYKKLNKPGAKSVLLATLFGIPLPLCSCSVIPIASSLRRAGASKGATAGFFVSTPEIGVDSFILSYGLLGLPIALMRVASAFVTSFFVGITIDTFVKDDTPNKAEPAKASCCENEQGNAEKRTLSSTIKRAFTYGYVDVVEDIVVSLVIGFFLAGLVSALFPPDFFQSVHLTGIRSILLMMVVSLPLYICATSSTPLAALLIAKGLNPGAAIAFMLTGPASNITTMTVILKELGKASLMIYITGIMLISFLMGLLADSLLSSTVQETPFLLSLLHTHDEHSLLPGLILSFVLLYSLFKRTRASCH